MTTLENVTARPTGAALTVSLLGTPSVQRDGEPVKPPRGHKPWALLAYTLLTEVPPSRQQLAGLLFEDADDPFGALRWSLSQLRRLLGGSAIVEGDPLRVALPSGALVDVEILSRGTWVEAVTLPSIGRPLLEGVDVRSPAFDLWLANERRHVAGLTEAVLHQAALASLARGATEAAVDHASRLVALNPFDENGQVLLVRCLRAAGRPEDAARQVRAATKLFEGELGVSPSPALRTAAAPGEASVRHVGGRAAILAKLEAGESAVAAGALQAGLEALRGAAAMAKISGDRHLLARSLVAQGGALVHAARGSDEEGVAALHEASVVAEELGVPLLAATALREIAWVEFLRARYDRAQTTLARAAELAAGNDPLHAWIDAIRAACLIDTADYKPALRLLDDAIERADGSPDRRAAAFARMHLGRLRLLRGELSEARPALDEALELVRAESWTSFLPFPQALRAEVDLLVGEIDAADEGFAHAYALGCQLGDPCWESLGARGLGLVAAARGDVEKALELLAESPRMCSRLPDSYLWLEAYAWEALCRVAIEHEAPGARRWLDQLEAFTSHRGMRELVVRAAIHRARLGDTGAAEAARALAAGIDNPALDELLVSAAS